MKAIRIAGLIIVMTMSLHFANAQYVNNNPNGNVYYDIYGNAYYPMNNGYVRTYTTYPVYYNAPRVVVRLNTGPAFNQGYYKGNRYYHYGNRYYRGYNGWHRHYR